MIRLRLLSTTWALLALLSVCIFEPKPAFCQKSVDARSRSSSSAEFVDPVVGVRIVKPASDWLVVPSYPGAIYNCAVVPPSSVDLPEDVRWRTRFALVVMPAGTASMDLRRHLASLLPGYREISFGASNLGGIEASRFEYEIQDGSVAWRVVEFGLFRDESFFVFQAAADRARWDTELGAAFGRSFEGVAFVEPKPPKRRLP